MFYDKKKKGTSAIIQPNFQFYGIVLEKPTAEEWDGCHFSNKKQRKRARKLLKKEKLFFKVKFV